MTIDSIDNKANISWMRRERNVQILTDTYYPHFVWWIVTSNKLQSEEIARNESRTRAKIDEEEAYSASRTQDEYENAILLVLDKANDPTRIKI
ncbi:unnamed protein product [Ambrosiozyma monospora]|uniref:Unnamed protein product n=1 Tax=Ambrosiozyma monospora TaxID=43982 RepID=A0A9W6Z0E1_AMBMO|nr:unnamed protein product [Ambrosiozyma monospora]